eukprot:6833402-Pyramimonas_sp.AAC.3
MAYGFGGGGGPTVGGGPTKTAQDVPSKTAPLEAQYQTPSWNPKGEVPSGAPREAALRGRGPE